MRLVPEVEVVLSSPYTRAWQTAEIMEQKGWPAPVSCEQLKSDHPLHKVVSVLMRYINAESVAVSGTNRFCTSWPHTSLWATLRVQISRSRKTAQPALPLPRCHPQAWCRFPTLAPHAGGNAGYRTNMTTVHYR